MLNKKFLGTLWKYSDINYKKCAVLDYLKNCKLDNLTCEKLTVYDPVSATTINCIGTVPKQLIEFAKLAPHFRLPYLEALSNRKDLEDGGMFSFLFF